MAIFSKPTATATTRRKATVSVFFIITMLALFLLLSVLRISDAFVFVSPGTQHRVSEYDVASKATIISSKSNTLIPSSSFSSQKPIRILRAVQQEQEREQEEKTANTNTNHTNEYERLIYEAERIRLEAEKLDADLTLQKISVLERKLSNNAWLEKQTGQTVKDLYEQLRLLQTKIDCPAVDNGNKVQQLSNRKLSSSSLTTATTTSTLNASSSNHESSNNRNIPPIAGFDDDDLDLYVPIAKDVTAIAPNATMEELLQLFRDAPELQEHFKDKIQKMFMGPLEDMQELETLKQEYFDSSSSREREALLKQIRRLEKKNDEQNIDNGESVDGGIAFSDSIKISPEALPPLSQDELDLRYETIKALPDILVAVYLQRNGLYESPVALSTINVNIGGTGDTGFSLNISNANDNGNDLTTTTTTTAINEDVNNIEEKDSSFDLYEDLKLAIQLDYYNLQIQLLIQAQNIEPITEDVKAEFASAFRSLPEDVRKRIAVYNFGVNKFSDTILTSDNDEDVEQITNEILKEQNSPFLQLGSLKDLGNKTKRKNMMIFGNGEKNEQKQQPVVLPEYNDVEFVDRSRYLEEFFPSVALLEDQHPTKENVDLFVAECLSPKNKPFMVTSKPERVIGGYYVRGTNQLLNSLKLKADDDDDDNTTTAADMLVQQVNRRLQDHPSLKDKIEFYYILDPSPPTEEDMELGIEPNPIILVTSKDPQTMYGLSAPFTKSFVTLLGLVSPFLFSIGSCALNPKVNNELEKALENGAGVINIQWFYDLSLPLYFSMLGILVAHEIAHRIAASYHKVSRLGIYILDFFVHSNNMFVERESEVFVMIVRNHQKTLSISIHTTSNYFCFIYFYFSYFSQILSLI